MRTYDLSAALKSPRSVKKSPRSLWPIRIDSFTIDDLCELSSASSLSSRCDAFRSTESTHTSSAPPPPAMFTSSLKIAVFVPRFASAIARRMASGLCSEEADATKASQRSRVYPA